MDKRERIWWIDFAFMLENRAMKPSSVLRRLGGRMREKMEEVNLIKMYYKYICKCHNVIYKYTII
jgi:hypothetical protein